MTTSTGVDRVWREFVATRDPALREELIVEYAPLVKFVVGRLGIPTTTIIDQDDLMSYGVIGLINAIDRFDPSRGIRFEAFATARIRGAVIDQLRSLNWLPRSAVARVRQIEGALAALEQRLGRPAMEQEVAAELNVPIDRYRQMLQEAGTLVLSLDAPLGSLPQEDGVTSLADLLEDLGSPGPAEQVEQQELLHLLSKALDQLPSRERMLLALYYQEEMTMKEISRIMQVSESRVCQLHMQAVLRLRTALNLGKVKAAKRPRATLEASQKVRNV